MATFDNWAVVKTERQALADDLGSLDDKDWATPSLCDDWTVHDVLAHMTATAQITPGAFFSKLIGSGFSLKKMQAKDIAVERGSSGADTLARFRSNVSSTKSPLGPKDTWLGETIIHSEDIRRPLGIQRDYPTDAVARVADFYPGSNLLIWAKRRIAGLQLTASDTSWTHGQGPRVSGPILALLMAMTGRKAGLVDLEGDGVETLRARP
jgi:uncharacterized protein (TIGR03083 family)